MLPYIYLAYILSKVNDFNPFDLRELWNYDKLFPVVLSVDTRNNRELYWTKINKELLKITNSTEEEFSSFIKSAKKMKKEYIKEIINQLKERLDNDKKAILNNLDKKTKKEVEELYINLKLKSSGLKKTIDRIIKFRL
jgi:hypothetical protein